MPIRLVRIARPADRRAVLFQHGGEHTQARPHRELIERYREDRNEGEPFGDWALRVGKGHIQEVLAEYKEMPVFEKDPMAFVDWDANKLFTLDDMGEGECAV
jgi:hypothetical protein